ncbi:MAG: 50S ribosomal protein L13 [Candidatus Diapherotrites archaeon]|uniref:Large ribosomal subunit protein uL13 n=1 Tax=Candidatus Iainarchaeum sp. TaxID=3101447 RepID=A0A938YVF6_9ARCH|nr:50S ribosomal protein L13 [Candidatus Diapherotrites archaeon]
MEKKTIIMNAENSIVGRLASFAAKNALEGNQVVIINAEKAILTGSKQSALSRMKRKLDLRGKGNPRKGPKFSRMPDRVLRRAVRGMLPFTSRRGREALRRVMVFISVPAEFQGKELTKLPGAKVEKRKKYVELGEVCRLLGARW